MLEKRKYEKPIRAWVPEVGYNYIRGYGEFLTEEFFRSASEFNDQGFAEVVTFSGERKQINKEGKLFELKC